MKTRFLIGILCTFFALASCSDDDSVSDTISDDMMDDDMMDDDMMDDDMMDDDMMDDDMMDEQTTSTLMVNFQNLQPLPMMGQTYEAWLVIDSELVSVGTFSPNVDDDIPVDFEVNTEMLENAFGFMVSVEPMNDMDASQSDIAIMSGPFNNDIAMVTTNMQIGDFSNASGTFFLRTPTDEAPMTGNNGNDQFGVIFGDIDQGMPPVANFMLPELDETRWIYEGWVIAGNTPLSTGRFNAFDMRDDFNGFSETLSMGPELPGEDFFNNPPMMFGLTFPLDIRGNMVMITVEPVNDFDPDPFVIQPLSAMAMDMLASNQDFNLNMAGIPSAVATR